MARVKKVGSDYNIMKIYKHATINILKPEKLNELVKSLPYGVAKTIDITEKPVLDGCSIRATAINGKIANYSVWYGGSTEYIDNPKYAEADEETKAEMCPLMLNKQATEEATEMYRFSTLDGAINALAEFAPDW